MTRLRDARLSTGFTVALTFVLGTVAASIIINIVSEDWGWSALWPVLSLAAWIVCVLGVLSIEYRSPLRNAATVAIILLVGVPFGATALTTTEFSVDPRFPQFMLVAAGAMAMGSLTLAIVLPGWLRTWDGMVLALTAAFIAVLYSQIAVWLRVPLAVVVVSALFAGFLTLNPSTAPAMGRYGRRLRRTWVRLITTPSDRAPNRRRRPRHASPGSRNRAPIGARAPAVRRSRTMSHPTSSGASRK